jgi:hypothetical protein
MENNLLGSSHFQKWWHLTATPRTNRPADLKQTFLFIGELTNHHDYVFAHLLELFLQTGYGWSNRT